MVSGLRADRSGPALGTGAALTPRPHQLRALNDLQAVLETHDRATVTLPCGSGKTRLGSLLAERRRPRRTVVFVPSLALVAQSLSEWRTAGWPFEAMIVCSDKSTADGVRERASLDGGDVAAPFWARHRALVTTSPRAAADLLRGGREDWPLVVFSTYHSAPVLEEAARIAGVGFDLVIADEAHHLAGRPRPEFRTVFADRFPAAYRVFMTATPIMAAAGAASISMADQRLFGPVAHHLTLAAAVSQGLLADYRVMVFEAPGERDPDPVAALIAAAERGMSRVLTFHGRVAKARRFAQLLDGHQLADGRRVWARHVAGTDSAAKRARILRGLEAVDPATTLAVVASARCLSEGVNLPAVDAVMFADPRSSQTGVVQAAGRVMRPAPGKSHGTVLIPVSVGAGLDDDTLLSTSSFAAAWKILRSLRDQDPRLADVLRGYARGESRRGAADGSRPTPLVTFHLPSIGRLRQLVCRLVEDATSTSWEEFLAELRDFVARTGHARPPASHRLHEWCQRQRRAYRTGLLLPERAAALRAVPGWVWDLDEARFLDQWAAVVAAAGDRLDVFDPARMDRPVPLPSSRSRARTVGRWCAEQRILARRGDLPADRRARIEQIPGWDWAPLPRSETAYVDLLGEYLAWKGHTDVAADYVDDDLPLGAWLAGARRRRVLGLLPQPLLDELNIITPVAPAPGALQWRQKETRWALGLEALQAFAAREGHCRVPDQHREPITGTDTDTTIALYVWCRHQRHARRTGDLAAARIAQLDTVPGWQWEIQPGPRVLMDIGDSRHGTRTGYVKGCRCEACTEANRATGRARDARARAGGPSTDLVDAARTRGQLRILQGQGATQKGLSRATGLEVKAIVEILNGCTRRVLPSTEAAVLAITRIEQVRAAAAPGTLIPAGPTWKLLDELTARGWPKAWIARELGLSGAVQFKRTEITAANAGRVARLYRAIGDLTPPRLPRGTAMPPLADLLPGAAFTSTPAARSAAPGPVTAPEQADRRAA